MRYLITMMGVIFSIPLFMFKKAFETNVLHQEIEVESVKQETFRLFFISDIHRRKISNRLIEKVGSDIKAVIIGGDLAERGVSLEQIEENIKQLAKIGPLIYVWGNNDREVGERHIRKFILNEGGILLENEAICLQNQREQLWIVGIDDVSSGRANIEKSFAKVPERETVVFVSHTPFVFNKVIERYKPSVLLAGHTHGGQIRVGKWGYYQRGTLKSENNVVTLISNGFGTTFMPLRLGAPAECHILSIMPLQNE
ncbi:metallophosphoesterase [Paenisporosarcina indica]|uniref:metallophosphoesterase n=1 Tax=Paenisporosarcina indica TaxID=650093 RepID=UPI00094F4E28|nr:metallophosphoesterase [Paenisporosarcina indica]